MPFCILSRKISIDTRRYIYVTLADTRRQSRPNVTRNCLFCSETGIFKFKFPSGDNDISIWETTLVNTVHDTKQRLAVVRLFVRCCWNNFITTSRRYIWIERGERVLLLQNLLFRFVKFTSVEKMRQCIKLCCCCTPCAYVCMYGTYAVHCAIFCSLGPVLRIPNNTEKDSVLYVFLLDLRTKKTVLHTILVSQLPEHYQKIYPFVI